MSSGWHVTILECCSNYRWSSGWHRAALPKQAETAAASEFVTVVVTATVTVTAVS